MSAEPPARSRGVIGLLEENCTACMLCARECPDWCIYIESHKEPVPDSAQPEGRGTAEAAGQASSGAAGQASSGAAGQALSGAAGQVTVAAGRSRPRVRNALDRFAIDFSLCMYCGICVDVCPYDALFWSPEYAYPATAIADLTHERGRLREWMWTVPPPVAPDPGAPPLGGAFAPGRGETGTDAEAGPRLPGG